MRVISKAFLVSLLIGSFVGLLMSYNPFQISKIWIPYPFFDKYVIGLSMIVPILTLVLELILMKRFAIVWEKTVVRTFCIFFMIWGYIFGISRAYISSIGEMPLAILIMSLYYPLIIVAFIYSSVITIIATYLATKDVENLYKRLIIAFLLIWAISSASSGALWMRLAIT